MWNSSLTLALSNMLSQQHSSGVPKQCTESTLEWRESPAANNCYATQRSLQAKVANQTSVPWSRTSMTGATPYLCRWIMGGMQSFASFKLQPAQRQLLHDGCCIRCHPWDSKVATQRRKKMSKTHNPRTHGPTLHTCRPFVLGMLHAGSTELLAMGAACCSWQQCIATQDAICYSPLPGRGFVYLRTWICLLIMDMRVCLHARAWFCVYAYYMVQHRFVSMSMCVAACKQMQILILWLSQTHDVTVTYFGT